MLNHGSFIAIKTVIPNSSAIRINIAKNIPILVALLRCSTGSFPVAIEIKMMLSMPNTISKNVNVNKAIQAFGFDKISDMVISYLLLVIDYRFVNQKL